MFDQIVKMVKDQLDNTPEVKSAIPPQEEDAIHTEVAAHIDNGIKQEAAAQGGVGGLLSSLAGSLGSGSNVTNAITGGLAASLASKFGLPPAVTGAIAGALPGILQKFAHKANDPNDNSVTPESIQSSLGGLGGLFK
ncbi:hypothetical protein [Hufsiella ginkgonis]|uniref:DUF937 domain-containing protein n=1 Tax=Hufsiella ginkgonis TaxID=2695274 RepID=A0A7K1XU43_9SPHI|nr:hypothetical protein [Hufsiella ginkgonis]MXV14525.1 hypothetical protein [Hufsiella ginkgonis]